MRMGVTRTYVRVIVIVILLLLLGVIVIPITMRIMTNTYMFVLLGDVPKTDVGIVLGASVARGEPSPVLAQRADVAIRLYRAGKVGKILVTGDNGALTHDEVTPVRTYLTDAGIPAPDIFLDHAGFDTYSSIYRAKAIFGASSATIVSQDFHLPRALFIARSLGLDAYGVVALGEGGPYDYLREVPASIKALSDIATYRIPKYLGDPIPLLGDGTQTWY